MRPLRLFISAVLTVLCAGQGAAVGQMFGRGGTTTSSSSSSSPRGISLLDSVGAVSLGARSNAASVGTVQGTERFLRMNRQGEGFIGADFRDRRRFIGARPGTTTSTRPILPPVQLERAVPQTQAVVPARRRGGMYDPPLEVGFDYGAAARQGVSAALAQHLRSSPALDPANRIEVSVEGTTATLRGEVVSERDRALAEQLVLFEPGVYAVRNELRVRPAHEPRDGWRPSRPDRIPKAASGQR